ncbi:MAG: 16S rRNA (uracil(1498)-N(3))-methyltransferase [Frankiaceae bacterium]
MLPVFAVDALPAVGHAALGGPEGRHAARVLRVRPGELVELADGRGGAVRCRVLSASRDGLELAVQALRQEIAPVPRFVVVQALAAGEHGELAVDLLTQVGVDEIVPWAAHRSVVRWTAERGERALQRWRAAAHAAAKQSRRVHWPAITLPATTTDVAARLSAATLGLVLDSRADRPLAEVRVPTDGEVVLVVGPEGGFTDAELNALDAGVRCRLGPTVLRSSAAGAVAAAVALAHTPRWTDRQPAR